MQGIYPIEYHRCVAGQHLFPHLPALGILLTAQDEVGEDMNRGVRFARPRAGPGTL